MAYLHDIFNNTFARKALVQVKIPAHIEENLKYPIRPYQKEAFKRYIYLDSEEFEEKPNISFIQTLSEFVVWKS